MVLEMARSSKSFSHSKMSPMISSMSSLVREGAFSVYVPLRRVGIGILLDVPTRIGLEDEEDNEEDFLEDEEVDSMTLGGEQLVVNFRL